MGIQLGTPCLDIKYRAFPKTSLEYNVATAVREQYVPVKKNRTR
jgi:hypothetical protein